MRGSYVNGVELHSQTHVFSVVAMLLPVGCNLLRKAVLLRSMASCGLREDERA